MKRILAHLASTIFHPVLLATYASLILIYAYPDKFLYGTVYPKLFVISIFFNTVFLPGVSLLLLRGLGFVKSLTMRDRMDRTLPYVAGMFFYIWTTVSFIMRDQPVPGILKVLVLGVTIGLVMAFLTNVLVMKVSLHTTGMGAFVAFLTAIAIGAERDITLLLILAILGAGWVGTSRLILKAHQRDEVFAGYLVGMVAMLLAFRFI